MERYLVIITTVLVVTQVLRLIQNTIQLKHMKTIKEDNNKLIDDWKVITDRLEILIENIK